MMLFHIYIFWWLLKGTKPVLATFQQDVKMVRIRGQIRRLPLGLEATAGLRLEESEKNGW